jgi:hypothetical protein
LAIASIALILAIGGGSFALAISDRKSDRRIARHVATRQIHRLAHTLQVKHARVARRAKFAEEATNAGTVNGVSVTQFSAKVQPGQPAAILADTGLATLRGTCGAGGQHGVLLTKDVGSPRLRPGIPRRSPTTAPRTSPARRRSTPGPRPAPASDTSRSPRRRAR